MVWMNSPENARLARRRPPDLVPQPEAGDSLTPHCGPDDRSSRRDRAEGRPSGVNVHLRPPRSQGDGLAYRRVPLGGVAAKRLYGD